MCVFLISPVPIAEPLTSELIDTPVFYNLAPRPIKYRVSVPIPTDHTVIVRVKGLTYTFLMSSSTVCEICLQYYCLRSFSCFILYFLELQQVKILLLGEKKQVTLPYKLYIIKSYFKYQV